MATDKLRAFAKFALTSPRRSIVGDFGLAVLFVLLAALTQVMIGFSVIVELREWSCIASDLRAAWRRFLHLFRIEQKPKLLGDSRITKTLWPMLLGAR